MADGCAALGLVWVTLWRPWYRNSPAGYIGISCAELELIGPDGDRDSHHGIPWGGLFRSRQLWLIMLMYSCYGWGSYFYLSWLHTYLVKGRGLTETEIGIFSTLPFILGTGANLGGVLLISAGYGCMDLMLPSAWAMCLDLGERYSGAVSGAMNSAGHVGGFTCSVLFGYIVRRTGNYNTPLVAIATMLMVAAFLFSRIDASKPIVWHKAAIEVG